MRRYHCPKCDVYASALYGSTAIHAPCGTVMNPVVYTRLRSPAYLQQMASAVQTAELFCAYARSIGAKFATLDEMEVTPTQAEQLDAWWREHTQGGTRTARLQPRCNCDASCGENRYHDRGEPGCRYHCPDCLAGVPTEKSDSLTVHARLNGTRPVCKRIHG